MSTKLRHSLSCLVMITLASLTGCVNSHWGACGPPPCGSACGSGCQPACEICCEPACESGCGVEPCGHFLADLDFALFGWMCRKSNAIPDTLPLGSTVGAHYQVMETNGEAADFIIHRHDFVGRTAALTPDGKDKVLEIAARMRSTPFPVVIERGMNNSDAELDALRRNIVATVLADLGNHDAQQRTVVATSYGPGYTSRRGAQMYNQHVFSGGGNNNNGGGNNGGGFGGGAGGGGFGGGGGGGF